MKSSFQTILVVVFGIVFAGAVLVFSGLISFGSKSADKTPSGNVVIWGIFSQQLIQPYLDNFNIANNGYSITYTQINKDTFQQEIIESLANGTSPDLVLFSSEQYVGIKDKLNPIPYSIYSERVYRDTYIDGAQIFLTGEGISAMPLLVDPLVIYYNKDILAQANFVIPPKTWSNLQQITPVLTKKDGRNNIVQAAIALGTSNNVDHLQDILSALFLQTGNSIVSYNVTTGAYQTTFEQGNGESLPTAQALAFYTSFSNPTNTNYSWNSSLSNSLSVFLAGKSAFYIGRASELFTIQSQNPNLNFDVSEILQTGGSARPVTYGSFIGVGIMKRAPNQTAVFPAALFMSSSDSVDTLSKSLSLPPVRRELLLRQQLNPYVSIFFNAALTSFSWPNPNKSKSEVVFRDMINQVTSGQTDPTSAINAASRDLQSIFTK